jgi:hypothetical protein
MPALKSTCTLLVYCYFDSVVWETLYSEQRARYILVDIAEINGLICSNQNIINSRPIHTTCYIGRLIAVDCIECFQGRGNKTSYFLIRQKL